MGKYSLNRLFSYYAVSVMVWSVMSVFLMLVVFNVSVQNDVIYQANYPEKILEQLSNRMQKEDLSLNDFPDFIRVDNSLSMNDNYSVFSEKEIQIFNKMKKNETYINGNFLWPRIYKILGNSRQKFYVSYRILGDFHSLRLRQYLLAAEPLIFFITFIIWVVGFGLITRAFSSKINKELDKITQVNQEIEQFNLQMNIPISNIKEFQEVLESLNSLKEALATSLKKQWKVQEEQKVLIQTLSHDIRTPITVVKGNVELLLEAENESDRTEATLQLQMGVNRLEKLLYLINSKETNENNQTLLNAELINSWIFEIEQLCEDKAIEISNEIKDTSDLLINSEEVWNALNNIINNAIDFSPIGSKIILQFKDEMLYYEIVVQDEGPGFTEESLQFIGNTVYSSRKGKDFHQGKGLYLSNYWVKKNKGELIFNNRYLANEVVGSEVIIRLTK